MEPICFTDACRTVSQTQVDIVMIDKCNFFLTIPQFIITLDNVNLLVRILLIYGGIQLGT